MLNAFDAEFGAHLSALLPEGTLIAPEPRYLVEPRGKWPGHAGAVARPRTTGEVACILAECNRARVGVVPYGGGTGLVGGQVMPASAPAPLVLSLERMQRLRGLWPLENTLTIEAGASLARVQEAAAEVGRLFPLQLASEGTATIGGNLATNAGGTQVLRYGTARDLCLGVEAVLASGEVIHGLKRLRKDNTGYDLRNLLIGSEGSLAVITAASLRLFVPPVQRVVAMLAVASPKAAQELLALCEAEVGGMITGFEIMARQGFDFLIETGFDLRAPFDVVPDWLVLLDLGLPKVLDADETMAQIYAAADAAGLILDGVVARSDAQAQALWRLRETIPDANRRVGAISSHDISLPLSEIPAFIDEAQARLGAKADIRINCFGHLGDGNLHFNLFPAKGRVRGEYAAVEPELVAMVHALVRAFEGSISAEHGVGRLKAREIAENGDPGRLSAMRALKAALDPNGIMNPGALLLG